MVIDGREGDVSAFRDAGKIGELCREYRTDGLMILLSGGSVDFRMEFFNPDGSGGMMCGNGGRCIVAFADYLGLKPASSDGVWLFEAPDGLHEAKILSGPDRQAPRAQVPENLASGKQVPGGAAAALLWTVRLKMIDVHGITPLLGGFFLNTGTRHFVKFVRDVDAIDVEADGHALRWNPAFAPEGTNVNFVERCEGFLKVRTFEKGVEGETLACGTGITASAIAAQFAGIGQPEQASSGKSWTLQCRRGDLLKVDFNAAGEDFTEVHLTGPAELCVRTGPDNGPLRTK